MMHGTLGSLGPTATPLRPSLLWLLAVFATTLLAMIVGASTVHKTASALAAVTFALALIGSAVWTQSPLWSRPHRDINFTQRDAVRQTATLIMLAFLWCALAFYAIYLGTNIRWQHGWEYGSGLLLIALGYGLYLWNLGDPQSAASSSRSIERAVWFSAVQAVLVAIGLIYLIKSGKLSSVHGDWPANQVFLAGGFAIMCISVILIKTCASIGERVSAPTIDQR